MAEETPDNRPIDPDPDPTRHDAEGEPGVSDASDVPTDVNAAESAIESVAQAAEAVKSAVDPGGDGGTLDLPDLDSTAAAGAGSAELSLLGDVALKVKVELGRTRMYVEDVLRLNADSVIELDKAAGDPVDIYVNDRHVARGEVLVLNENFCVRVSEIISEATDGG